MASHHPIRKNVSPEAPVIPDKLYFRIGDVAALCEVPAYVLRFWETEFPQLKPNKGGTGQRLYRKRDVEMALRIKSLLYDQGYTIAGARQVFKAETQPKEAGELTPLATVAPAAEYAAVDAVTQAMAVAAPSIDIGAAIRQDAPYRDRLAAIRAELQSLADLLGSRPVHVSGSMAAEPVAAPARLKLMRPRLIPDVRPELRPAPRLMNQGDLFPCE